jgi:hypothetical protein
MSWLSRALTLPKSRNSLSDILGADAAKVVAAAIRKAAGEAVDRAFLWPAAEWQEHIKTEVLAVLGNTPPTNITGPMAQQIEAEYLKWRAGQDQNVAVVRERIVAVVMRGLKLEG